MKRTSNKGFSLVELIVVIAIMAIIAAVAIPVFSGYIDDAKEARDKKLIDDTKKALYYAVISDKSGVYNTVANGETMGVVSIVKYSDGTTEWIAQDAAANAVLSSGNPFSGTYLALNSITAPENGFIAPALQEAGLWGKELSGKKNDGYGIITKFINDDLMALLTQENANTILGSNYFNSETIGEDVSDVISNVGSLVNAYGKITQGDGNQVVFDLATSMRNISDQDKNIIISAWQKNDIINDTFNNSDPISVMNDYNITGGNAVTSLALLYANIKSWAKYVDLNSQGGNVNAILMNTADEMAELSAEAGQSEVMNLLAEMFNGILNEIYVDYTDAEKVLKDKYATSVADYLPAINNPLYESRQLALKQDAEAFIATMAIADTISVQLTDDEKASSTLFNKDGLVSTIMTSGMDLLTDVGNGFNAAELKDALVGTRAAIDAERKGIPALSFYMVVYKDGNGNVVVKELA